MSTETAFNPGDHDPLFRAVVDLLPGLGFEDLTKMDPTDRSDLHSKAGEISGLVNDAIHGVAGCLYGSHVDGANPPRGNIRGAAMAIQILVEVADFSRTRLAKGLLGSCRNGETARSCRKPARVFNSLEIVDRDRSRHRQRGGGCGCSDENSVTAGLHLTAWIIIAFCDNITLCR